MRERLRLLQSLKPSAVRVERRAHANVLIIGETQVTCDSDDDAEWVAACVAFTGAALDELDGLEKRNALLGERPTQILEARVKTLDAELASVKAKLTDTEAALTKETALRTVLQRRVRRLVMALIVQNTSEGEKP